MKTLECAAADCEGDVTMFLDAQSRRQVDRIVPSRDGGRRLTGRAVCRYLASEHLDRVDAMKLDCEGARISSSSPFPECAPCGLAKGADRRAYAGRWSMDLRALIGKQGYREALPRQNIIFERRRHKRDGQMSEEKRSRPRCSSSATKSPSGRTKDKNIGYIADYLITDQHRPARSSHRARCRGRSSTP